MSKKQRKFFIKPIDYAYIGILLWVISSVLAHIDEYIALLLAQFFTDGSVIDSSSSLNVFIIGTLIFALPIGYYFTQSLIKSPVLRYIAILGISTGIIFLGFLVRGMLALGAFRF